MLQLQNETPFQAERAILLDGAASQIWTLAIKATYRIGAGDELKLHVAYLRTVERHGEPLRIRHPADSLGDLGAATGTMLAVLAALDVRHPRTAADAGLVFAASDTTPYRSACVVRKGRRGMT